MTSAHNTLGGVGPARVLVVDDEEVIRELLTDFLIMEGFQVLSAANGRIALEVLAKERVNLVISDLKMPEIDGLELLDAIGREYPEVVTLLMTGYGTVETAIAAMKRGAFDYVLKPFKMEGVVHSVRRGLEQQRLRMENIELRAALSLYQLSARLGDEIELGPVLTLVTEALVEQLGAHGVSVVLLPEHDVDWAGASAGAAPALLTQDLTEAAFGLREAVVANGGRAFRYLLNTARTKGITAALITSLMSAGNPLGLLVAVRRGGKPFTEGDRKLLTIVADRSAAAVHNAQLFSSLERTFLHTIEALVTTLEGKDRYTAGHSERVAEYARMVAQTMGLPEKEIALIYQAGRLHDIGKLAIRTEELNKPTGLTNEEYLRFKAHPGYGEDLIARIPTFRPLLPGVGGHHEKFDGTGYPRGLKGEEIPLQARIMAVADTYDAMTSHRAYRAALDHEVAVTELKRHRGTQFCPVSVDAFLEGIEGWRAERPSLV